MMVKWVQGESDEKIKKPGQDISMQYSLDSRDKFGPHEKSGG